MQAQRVHRGIIGLVGVASLSLVLAGCGGGEEPAPQTPTTGETPTLGQQTGAPPMLGPSGQMSSGGGMPSMPGAPGSYGASSGPAAPAAAGPTVSTPPPNRRNDPFAPWWPAPPPPAVTSLIDPVRIATLASVKQAPEDPVEVREVPSRRVAGILTGNGVYALIDGGGDRQSVVKPGDMLDDYRVESINADSVTLRRKVNNHTYTQVVPLSDAGSAPAMRGGGRNTGPGMMPGMMPGMGGPGMGPGMMMPGGMRSSGQRGGRTSGYDE